ncbi:hypothetical protein D0Y65_023100 [Glycine soja]|uniref:Uncharacterized protein n=1 Tax=Glycine soja TaxID=3848 RepID=A0A445IWH5_GLYSO|nr:hypothetical protein D0Y65_023100 [Glycine soja]
MATGGFWWPGLAFAGFLFWLGIISMGQSELLGSGHHPFPWTSSNMDNNSCLCSLLGFSSSTLKPPSPPRRIFATTETP